MSTNLRAAVNNHQNLFNPNQTQIHMIHMFNFLFPLKNRFELVFKNTGMVEKKMFFFGALEKRFSWEKFAYHAQGKAQLSTKTMHKNFATVH